MSYRTISFAKEARLLLGAWVLVMLAGVLSLVPVTSSVAGLNIHGMLESLVPFGAAFGIPLLATLAFGLEFQYRTMPTLLAQPVDRREIWREKMTLSIAAVLPATVVYCLALRALESRQTEGPLWVIAVAVVATAASPFYTFVARSTIGGLVLNLAGFFSLSMLLDYLAYQVQVSPHNGYQTYDRNLRDLPTWFIVTAIVVLAAYAITMAWLGRRSLLRYQALEGTQAGETVLPGSRFFPHALAEVFRCRRSGRVLNLIRREFHLLRIVWALGALCALAWTAMAVFGLLPTKDSERFLPIIALAVIGSVVIAVLAGTLSLGEEKTWGTHNWHMTLPIRVSAQWAVKLMVALLTSAVCATLVPLAILRIGGWLGGPRHGLVAGSIPWMSIAGVLLITFAAFWSACTVKGTVRATIWVIPAALSVIGSAMFAEWLMQPGLKSNWYYRAIGSIVAAVGAVRVDEITEAVWRLDPVINGFVIAIVVGVALIQTHRMFAARREETTATAVRALVPIAAAIAICGFATEGMFMATIQSYRQQEVILQQTHAAIIAAVHPSPEHARVERLTWNELSKDSRLSSGARNWLRDSTITVVTDTPEQDALRMGPIAPARLGAIIQPGKAGDIPGYSAVVRLADGNRCAFQFYRAVPGADRYYGGRISGVCD